MYNHLYEQSNGRSGASTIAAIDAKDSSNPRRELSPAQMNKLDYYFNREERFSVDPINRTDANGRSGPGAGPTTTSPGGGTNPSASNGGKTQAKQNPSKTTLVMASQRRF